MSIPSRPDFLKKILESLKQNRLYISKRKDPFAFSLRTDHNIFYPVLICRNIKVHQGKLDGDSINIAKEILHLVHSQINQYTHRQYDPTFNFYSTKPDLPFPNSWFMKHLSVFHLPDDIDTTALIYDVFIPEPSKRETLFSFSEKYIPYTYYSDKMPKALDLIVNCNWLQLTNLTSSHFDQLVYESITAPNWFQKTRQLSPHYTNAVVILYSLCFMSYRRPLAFSEQTKSALEAAIVLAEKSITWETEKMLLETSKLLLGLPQKKKKNIINYKVVIQESFPFFIAPLCLSFGDFNYKWPMLAKQFDLQYFCIDHQKILCWEHALLTSFYEL